MSSLADAVEVTCATEVFISAALLHREHPERPDFQIREIVNRAARERLTGELRPGVNVHASSHCVANREPKPSRYRMLYATGKHTRRLLLLGDDVHPDRKGKIFPEPNEIPEKYLPLLDWAKLRYEGRAAVSNGLGNGGAGNVRSAGEKAATEAPRRHLQVLLDLRLAGVHLANGEDPDDYVKRLREGWE